MKKFLPKDYSKNGFSFIELMVSLAILATIVIITISALNPVAQQKKARDARRRGDLEQYRIALEAYASFQNGLYPDHPAASWTIIDPQVVAPCSSPCGCLCCDLYPNLIDSCPLDPKSKDPYHYYYRSYNSRVDFALRADLENGDYWVLCSTGKAGETIAPDTYCNF